MIYYRPTDGDPQAGRIKLRPRACFLMTQLGSPVPAELSEIRASIEAQLSKREYELIDADSSVTGKDFLMKIWKELLSVPLGIAILHEDMRPNAISNVFYEVGLMHALGKETLVVKTEFAVVPSDFVRTEYVKFDNDFERRFGLFMEHLFDRAAHYELMAESLEKNPSLSIDYLRRAYLITGAESLRSKVPPIVAQAGWETRPKDSVESLFADF